MAMQSDDTGGQGADGGCEEQVEAARAEEAPAPAHRLRRPRQPAHRQLQVGYTAMLDDLTCQGSELGVERHMASCV